MNTRTHQKPNQSKNHAELAEKIIPFLLLLVILKTAI